MLFIISTWTSLSQEGTSLSNHAYARPVSQPLSTMVVTTF